MLTKDEFFDMVGLVLSAAIVFLLVGWWLFPIVWAVEKAGDCIWWILCKCWPAEFKRGI